LLGPRRFEQVAPGSIYAAQSGARQIINDYYNQLGDGHPRVRRARWSSPALQEEAPVDRDAEEEIHARTLLEHTEGEQ